MRSSDLSAANTRDRSSLDANTHDSYSPDVIGRKRHIQKVGIGDASQLLITRI